MLYGCLPLLKGWMYVYREPEGVLTLGQDKLLDTVDAPGFVLFFSMLVKESLDAKYVRLFIEIDGPERAYTIDASPFELKTFGLTSPTNYPAFVTVYDDVNKVYVGCVAPSQPIPFARRFLLKLVPPNNPVEESTAKPIIYKAAYALAKIDNEKEFRRSLLELLGRT
jgi:hypothetical protein